MPTRDASYFVSELGLVEVCLRNSIGECLGVFAFPTEDHWNTVGEPSKVPEMKASPDGVNVSSIARLILFSAIAIFTLVVIYGIASSQVASASQLKSRPSAPRNVIATAGNSSVVIRYLPPPSSGGYAVNHYLIDVRPGNQFYTCPLRNCSINGLTDGTSYFFTVAAVNKIGRGLYSSPSNRVTPEAPAPQISFSANGGSGAMTSEPESTSGATVLSANTFTYSGHSFLSWNTEPDGGGTSYSDGVTFNGSSAVTLYAQWAVGTYTVTFNSNDSANASITDSVSDADGIVLVNTFSDPGYAFIDWNTAANGSGTSYAGGASYSGPANIILFAQWDASTPVGTAPGWTSTNWSGYVLSGEPGGYQGVSAEWVVPTVNCLTTPSGQTADWVGVNGWNGAAGLFQDGTTSACLNGVEQTYAWWTDEAENYLSHALFAIQPADLIDAQVFQTASDEWEYYVKDLTSGAVSARIEPYSGSGVTAEWIAEDPGDPYANGLYSLPNFGLVTFTDLGLTVPGGNWYDPPYSDAIELIGSDGNLEALPTQVVGSGPSTSFTVYYESSG